MSTEERLKNLIGDAGMESRASEAEWDAFARKAHGALYTRRAAGVLGTVALVGVAVFAATTVMKDSPPELRPAPPASSESATPEPDPSATGNTSTSTIEVPSSEQELWYVQGEKLSWTATAMGGQIPENRASADPIAQRAAFWLDILTGEPLGAVQESGGTTTIPEGTEVLYVEIQDSTMFVDLSSEFESGGGTLSMQMRVAQVVYTATQFEGIDSARIMIEGEMVDAIGGEGIIVSEPLTRRDFQDVAPPVVVERPIPGQQFRSGDEVTGFANVFEANVSFRVLDAEGNELTTDFTTATCGSGCWGDYTKAIEFSVDEYVEGRLEVLTYSAEDGSPQDVISIPVVLVPPLRDQ